MQQPCSLSILELRHSLCIDKLNLNPDQFSKSAPFFLVVSEVFLATRFSGPPILYTN